MEKKEGLNKVFFNFGEQKTPIQAAVFYVGYFVVILVIARMFGDVFSTGGYLPAVALEQGAAAVCGIAVGWVLCWQKQRRNLVWAVILVVAGIVGYVIQLAAVIALAPAAVLTMLSCRRTSERYESFACAACDKESCAGRPRFEVVIEEDLKAESKEKNEKEQV